MDYIKLCPECAPLYKKSELQIIIKKKQILMCYHKYEDEKDKLISKSKVYNKK